MNNSTFILVYWRKEQKEFDKNFKILLKHNDKNAVHDLRVAIKKLRSCLKLFLLIRKKSDWKDLFSETRTLFSILGKERDIEICLELIAAYEKEMGETFSSFKPEMLLQLKHSQSWAQQALKNYSKKELAKITLLLRKDGSLFTSDQMLKKTIGAINARLQGVKKYYKQPHEMRKMLKDVYYWFKMLPEGSVSGLSFEKKLNKLLDEFGKWQDEEMLLIKIRHYRKDFVPTPLPEYEAIKICEKKIELKKEKLLKSVLHKTHLLSKETLFSL